MNYKSKKGFTLIELIIVIAILGIIALIAVPNLSGLLQRSKVNTDKRSAEAIGRAIRIWQTDVDAGTRTIPTAVTEYNDTTVFAGLCPDYIKSTYKANSYPGGNGKFYVASVAGGVNNSEQKIWIGIGGQVNGAGEEIKPTLGDSPAVTYDGTGAAWAFSE